MYGEDEVIEITEVLRLWRAGVPKKRIAARLGAGIRRRSAGMSPWPRRPGCASATTR